jgi:hypothetical protein
VIRVSRRDHLGIRVLLFRYELAWSDAGDWRVCASFREVPLSPSKAVHWGWVAARAWSYQDQEEQLASMW